MVLKDRIILVTGASRGIGRDISYALAEKGSHVIMTSRTESSLKEIESEIRAKGQKGFADDSAQPANERRDHLVKLGSAVIHHFINA